MQNAPLNPQESRSTMTHAHIAVLLIIVVVGAYLRFLSLGERSLWADEFATWHVSRMPLLESFYWQPEQNNTPLYQLFLRLLSSEAHPPEWILRLPAAIAGALAIPAVYLLARMMTCRNTALSLAALLAINRLQIDYSQEARPYSLLVLGTILCTWAFLKLWQQPSWWRGAMYAVMGALSFYSHYLSVFVIAAHAMWWSVTMLVGRKVTRPSIFVFSWGLLGMLCAPMLIHCLRTRTATAQGLGWIEPITWSSTISVLTSITLEAAWVLLVLAPTLVIYVARLIWPLFKRKGSAYTPTPRGLKHAAHDDGSEPEGLLVSWFAFSFLGLVVISLLAQPAMLARYALPAAVPALLCPLLMARRFHHNAPIFLALIFVVGTAPDWITRSWQVEPGFREMTAYVQEYVDSDTNSVALVIDNTTFPAWEDVERLPLAYYPVAGHQIREIQLDQDGRPKRFDVFHESRPLYLIVFRSNPYAIAQYVGAEVMPIQVNGSSFDQLLFSPYRLAKLSQQQP